jgi:HlyD family secretion protein
MSTTAAKKKFRVSPLVIFGVVLVAIIAVVAIILTRPKDKVEPFKTQQVTVGNIIRTVSSSGTLQPLLTINVGSQVSGEIKEVLVDFDSKVTKGQVMAIVDPETLKSQLISTQADLLSANQTVNTANANVLTAQANLALNQATYDRNATLFKTGMVSQAAVDQAKATLETSKAQIAVQKAAVATAQAKIKQSEASVNTAKINLSHSTIVAPITGVVVDRKVDPGTTVAASFNAPELFLVAQDLHRLQLQILVDESDIGQVRVGQAVNFTVDAFPDDKFAATVTQIRKSPQTQSNVVAYVVVAQAENPDLKLLPGMTANADITLERHTNVLRVANAALRWVPVDQQTARPACGGGFPGGGGGFGGGGFPGGGGGFPGAGGAARGGAGGAARGGARGGGNPMFIYDQLDLNADQTAKVEKIMDDNRKEARDRAAKMQKDMARGVQPDQQALRTEAQARQKATAEKVDVILTPAQKAKMQEIRSGALGPQPARGQVFVLRDGKPVRVGVGVGVSDGQLTQVFTTKFVRGDQTIISGGPQPKAAAPTGAAALGGIGGAPGRGPGR